MTQFANNPLVSVSQPRPQEQALKNSVPPILNQDRESALQSNSNNSAFMSQLDQGEGLQDPTEEQQAILDQAKDQITALNQKILLHCGVDPTYFGLDGAEIDGQFQQAQIDEIKKKKKEGGNEDVTTQTPTQKPATPETTVAEGTGDGLLKPA